MQKTDDVGTGGCFLKTSLTPSSRGEEEEIKAYVKEHHVALNTKDAPNPILSFDKCHEIFPMEIVAATQEARIREAGAYSGVQLNHRFNRERYRRDCENRKRENVFVLVTGVDEDKKERRTTKTSGNGTR